MTDRQHLSEPQAHCQGGMVGKSPRARAVQVGAAVEPRRQALANVHVVIQVAVARASDPAMWLLAARQQLVRCRHPNGSKLIVHLVLVWKEPRQDRLMVPGDRVVVPGKKEVATQRIWKRTDARDQRLDELALARDLDIAAVARGHIYAQHRNAWPSVQHNASDAPRQRDVHMRVEWRGDWNPRCENHAAITLVDGTVGAIAASPQAVDEQPRSRSAAGFGQDDHVVRSLAKPRKDCGRPWGRCGTDVERQNVESRELCETSRRRAAMMAAVVQRRPERCLERAVRTRLALPEPSLQLRARGGERRHK